MASNTGTTLPGGYRNSLGGPADEWYAQTNGTAYVSVTEACAAVPQAFRRNRTVIVGGDEYWWKQDDLSDQGLILKTAASSGGGGGGASSSASIAFEVTQDGEQTMPLPTTATGIAQVQKQTPNPTEDGSPPTTGETTEVNDEHTSYDVATRILTISEEAGIVIGQTVTVRYLYGSGPGGKVQASDIEGTLEADQLPLADDAYLQQLYALLKPLINQDFTPR